MMDNLIQVCAQAAAQHPDKTAFSFLDRRLEPWHSITFGELIGQSQQLASSLRKRLEKRTVVILLLPHGPGFILAFLACLFADLVPACQPLPRRREWGSLFRQMERLRIGTILCEQNLVARIMRHEQQPQALVLLALESLQLIQEKPCPRHDHNPCADPGQTAFMQFTSGTTGSPKGIAISHGNILDNSARIKRAMRLTDSDITVSWLPFHHDMGLIGHLIQTLYSGMTTHFLTPSHFIARPLDWLLAIEKHGATVSGAPNFGFQLCNQRLQLESDRPAMDLSGLRLLYCGSELINAQTISGFFSRLQPCGLAASAFYACYGMAEATLFVCGHSGLDTLSLPGDSTTLVCVGSGLEQAGVSVVAEQSEQPCAYEQPYASEQPCAEGETGEIVVETASVARYRSGQLAGNRLRTGDLGFIYNSRLYLVGRKPGRLKLHGKLIQAEQLEALLLNQSAGFGVQRIIVFQAAGNDQGMTLLAETRRRHSHSQSDWVKIQQHLENTCAALTGCIPDQTILLPPNRIPLTTSGKPIRERCIQLHSQGRYRCLSSASDSCA